MNGDIGLVNHELSEPSCSPPEMLGVEMGLEAGLAVGAEVRMEFGLAVGERVWLGDWLVVGTEVGPTDDVGEGMIVLGLLVGEEATLNVGLSVSLFVEAEMGLTVVLVLVCGKVGLFMGLKVGAEMGPKVGVGMGLRVGFIVGPEVGVDVDTTGLFDGIPVDKFIGDNSGFVVGSSVGFMDGSFGGLTVLGLAVGTSLRVTVTGSTVV